MIVYRTGIHNKHTVTYTISPTSYMPNNIGLRVF